MVDLVLLQLFLFIILPILQLLVKNPAKRLGCMEKGEEEIKSHLFFKMINWAKVEAREVQPPFKPKIVSSACSILYFEFSPLV